MNHVYLVIVSAGLVGCVAWTVSLTAPATPRFPTPKSTCSTAATALSTSRTLTCAHHVTTCRWSTATTDNSCDATERCARETLRTPDDNWPQQHVHTTLSLRRWNCRTHAHIQLIETDVNSLLTNVDNLLAWLFLLLNFRYSLSIISQQSAYERN